jgi:hypothetical protein
VKILESPGKSNAVGRLGRLHSLTIRESQQGMIEPQAAINHTNLRGNQRQIHSAYCNCLTFQQNLPIILGVSGSLTAFQGTKMNWSCVFSPLKPKLRLAFLLLPIAAATLCYEADPAVYVMPDSTNWVHDPWNIIPDPTTGVDRVVYVGMTAATCTNGHCADFDAIMRNFLVSNAHVYLGPGTFQTKGVWNGGFGQSDSTGFRVPSDCWITGSRATNGTNATVSCDNTNVTNRFRLDCLPAPYNVSTRCS